MNIVEHGRAFLQSFGCRFAAILAHDEAWPPVVEEEGSAPWQKLFQLARRAGVEVDELRGVTSDMARGW